MEEERGLSTVAFLKETFEKHPLLSNPRNTSCMSACPVGPTDRTGAVKIFACLGFEPRLNINSGFNWAGKIDYFSKVSKK